jgi:hypothetical protein
MLGMSLCSLLNSSSAEQQVQIVCAVNPDTARCLPVIQIYSLQYRGSRFCKTLGRLGNEAGLHVRKFYEDAARFRLHYAHLIKYRASVAVQ